MITDWMFWLYWLLVVVMLVGVAGALLPGIPGIGLIVLAIVVWGLVKGFSVVLVPLIVSAVLFLVGSGVDFLATYLGAKKAGASNWGQIGSVVGLLLGLFGFLPTVPIGGPIGPLLGVLLGAMVGAMVGEFLYRKDLMAALKAALGIVVGSLVGRVVQTILAIACVAVFLWATWGSFTPVPTSLPANTSSPEHTTPTTDAERSPRFKLPEWKAPNLDLPDFKLPDFKRPDFKLPDFKLPKSKPAPAVTTVKR
jgi:hypothetical protein